MNREEEKMADDFIANAVLGVLMWPAIIVVTLLGAFNI